MASTDGEPAYISISRRKREHLESQIPSEWRLTSEFLPTESTRRVLDVPRKCGLLTAKEVDITEKWDVKGLLGELKSGRLKAYDVVLAFCKRAAIAHQVTACLTEPLFTRALKQAAKLDDHLSRTGSPIGPLHGLPVSVKDTFDIAGIDSSIGITAFCFKPATRNAPLVNILESLGAIIVAKTNIPQTLAALDSTNNVFGRTMNPTNMKCTAGGSSGGEGVMVRMRGSMIGFGTDVGGSIRIPAMCNGVYGLKPSVGRFPYGGQQGGQLESISRLGLQAVAGPIAYSIADIDTVMSAIQSCAPWEFLGAEDVLPWTWTAPSPPPNLLATKPYLVGILASDGLVEPIPPIQHLLSNLATTLRSVPNISTINVPTPSAWSACQNTANSLMSLDGGNNMFDILELTNEPLSPWLKDRMRRGTPKTLEQVRLLQVKRSELEKQMNMIWTTADGRRIDTIVCPIAPHPVPPIDRWNAVNYTASFVLLDWPTGVVPIRDFDEADLRLDWLGGEPAIKGSWDRRNRELWDERTLGPDGKKVYLGTSLGVQICGRRGDERGCWEGMRVVDDAVRKERCTVGTARL